MISILSTYAFSFIKVAETLSKTLKAKYHKGFFTLNQLEDKVIIVGNPDYATYHLAQFIPKNKKLILYLVLEGKFIDSFIKNFLKTQTIITPSNYAKTKLEEADIHVAGVIPHGITVYTQPKTTNNHEMLYISGYIKRKYPEYGIRALTKAGYRPFVITSIDNPYIKHFRPIGEAYRLKDEDIHFAYETVSWYLNLSDSEGFGLTPLEAMAHGTVVIAPDIPPLNEYLNNENSLLVKTTGEKWYEPFAWELIEHHKYDENDMANKILKAINMNDNEYSNLSQKAFETAKKYEASKVYQKFLEYF